MGLLYCAINSPDHLIYLIFGILSKSIELKNDLILRAARGEDVERTPVWLMRQAGRILPEYRAVRSRLSGFKELVETPHLAAEVTVQPVDILEVDAAIIFSDILVIPDAMGLTYEMIEKKGPYFPETVEHENDLNKLRIVEGGELEYVYEAIKLTRSELNNRVPLIGFAGAPFTIFCYMIEGQGSKTFSKARKFIKQKPLLAHKLLSMIADSTSNYLKAQIEAGAQLIQLFDSWAGILSPDLFQKFSLPYISKICDDIDYNVPVTVFAKGAHFSFEELKNLKCNTFGLDWNTPPAYARSIVGDNFTLQGNLDPAILYGSGKDIAKETQMMLKRFGKSRHIANLGHGVYPDTSPEAVKTFIQTVKEYSHD